ncbi:MAG: FAD binding domain-containing protein [Candidatus Eiseniibacteriota bacterium]|nr:MAG: FAD binding domain-containing protein [Candidatus Eisenbacteria bacterium]
MIDVTTYIRPGSLEEALDVLASGEFTPLAGGTDLIPHARGRGPRKMLDLSGLSLDRVTRTASSIEVGACATHSELCRDAVVTKALPLLSKAAALVGTKQVRNRGTLGGNVVNASPCADTVPALLNHDAVAVLVSKDARRKVPVEAFITGPYATCIGPNELLTSIVCEPLEKPTFVSFLKLGRRQAVNISRMSLAVCLMMDGKGSIKGARVSAGAVFPVARRMREVERLLAGESPSKRLFAEAGALAAQLMVKESGVRWSTPYKRPVLAALLERALAEAASGNFGEQ